MTILQSVQVVCKEVMRVKRFCEDAWHSWVCTNTELDMNSFLNEVKQYQWLRAESAICADEEAQRGFHS